MKLYKIRLNDMWNQTVLSTHKIRKGRLEPPAEIEEEWEIIIKKGNRTKLIQYLEGKQI